jgi:hypothetical protein
MLYDDDGVGSPQDMGGPPRGDKVGRQPATPANVTGAHRPVKSIAYGPDSIA